MKIQYKTGDNHSHLWQILKYAYTAGPSFKILAMTNSDLLE